MSIELGTVQTETGMVDPAQKFKCTMAARGMTKFYLDSLRPIHLLLLLVDT